ncbi:putative DNA helicase chromatin remodeling SNF2 family [Helianthus annuus]|nr:putative DNA helicase chromatin remodeling SNF2 family [Helianthus annuus]KAJ0739653.1 putative DNA helicase chromatin remodeling SNF2 family [Helianthus annuus]
MDFSKTKIYQRTRASYDKLYQEYNQKKSNGRQRTGGGGGGENSKDKSSRKSSEVLECSDGGKNRNGINAVARRTRQAVRGRKKAEIGSSRGKNVGEVFLIDDDDSDGDGDGDGVQTRVSSGVEEDCESEEIGHGSENAENELETAVMNNTTALNGDRLKGKGGYGDEFDKDVKDSSLSSRGFRLSSGFQICESDEDDEVEGIMFLGDDPTCLDDYDPSHSSRVESNEVKVDSIQTDADAKVQGQKSFEEEDNDRQKTVSPEEDGSNLPDIEPVTDNNVARDNDVISLSSSSECEVGEKDGHAMEDDGFSASEIEDDDNNDDLGERFWELLQKETLDDCEPKKKIQKVIDLERVVSKKRGGSSKEGGSKKRRTDAESSHGIARNSNKGVEDSFWEIVDEKGPENVGTSTSKMNYHFRKINVMEILTDAIREEGDGDNVLKKYVDVPPEDILPEDIPIEKTQVDEVLSYKFKFEDEEDIKPEKLESEMEVDGLFDELNMCLQLSEIGSSDTRGVRCDSDFFADGANQATRCRRGKHALNINDEFGIVCRYCSFVEMEVRDILPPLSKNGRGGHGRHDHDHDKTDNVKLSDIDLPDRHHELHHESKGGEYEKGTVWDLVPGVKESMYPHQRDGFEFMWTKIAGGTYIDKLEKRLPTGGSGCIISHAPGTGKSRLTIVFLQAFLKMYPSSRPLIIAPRSMLLTWEEEFKKWNADFPFFNMNVRERSGQEHKIAVTLLKNAGKIKSQRGLRLLKLLSWKKTPSVLGITYRLFESLAGEEGKRKRDASNVAEEQMKNFLLKVPTLLVLDEGHTPRNDQSHMWKTLLNVKTKRSIILSGTPFQNNFDELYNTLCLVNPSLSFGISSLNGVYSGKRRGWKHTTAKGQWDSITSSVKKSQQKLLELKAMIDPFVHVHKGTILQERLPGLRDALVVLKPTKTQQTLLNRMLGSKLTIEKDHIMSLVSVHPSLLPESSCDVGGLHKMLKVFKNDPSAGVKTNFLMELIQLSIAHNEKVLVFSRYIKPLEFIIKLLKTNLGWDEGRECLYMDGQQEEKLRQGSIHTINDPKSEVKVLLASIKACSEGINLVGASRVVLLDVHWNPSVERQAISRAYRLGQKKVVHVYHLVTGSMESEKYIRQVEKSHLSELVFSSENKDSSNPKISSTVSKDKILEEMVHHDKLRNMFEKVIYQPKEADLINTFG